MPCKEGGQDYWYVDFYFGLIDQLIDFNCMSTNVGLFYALR